MRIEDTDRERSSKKAVTAILSDLEWLGLSPDLAPFYQSERGQYYRDAVERLLASGQAYHCYCTREELERLRRKQQASGQKPRYDGRCRTRRAFRSERLAGISPVVRFKTPREGSVIFDDLVHGSIEIANRELDDLVLLRSDGSPTYNLTAVVDDADMGITHVIRGDDHINNTPRQIHILQALGAPVPRYAHLPMILNPDRSRMSKRSGAVAIGSYRREGYLPQAMLNYLVRLGWSSGDQEIFSLEEMVRGFMPEAIGTSAVLLNPKKLKWLNQHYLQKLSPEQLLPLFEEQLTAMGFSGYTESAPQAFGFLRTRYKTLKEAAAGAAFIYGGDIGEFDAKKASRFLNQETKPLLEDLLVRLQALDSWVEGSIRQAIEGTLAGLGARISQLGPALRFAVTYGAASPELPTTLALVGYERCIRRLKKALEWIGQ